MTISSGIALGAGRWRIPATDVADAMIHPPPGFDGAIDLQVELKLADDTVIDRGWLRREWRQRPPVAAALIGLTGNASGNSTDHETDPTAANENVCAGLQLDQAQIDFSDIHAQGVTGDTSLAHEWYKKAAELGSQETQERLNILGR